MSDGFWVRMRHTSFLLLSPSDDSNICQHLPTIISSVVVQSEVERFEPKASSQTVPQSIVIGPDSEVR